MRAFFFCLLSLGFFPHWRLVQWNNRWQVAIDEIVLDEAVDFSVKIKWRQTTTGRKNFIASLRFNGSLRTLLNQPEMVKLRLLFLN